MEYMLLPNDTVQVTEEFSDRASVMRRILKVGAIAHYWYESSNNSWWCLHNTGVFEGLDELHPQIEYEDLPDVIKLATMLE